MSDMSDPSLSLFAAETKASKSTSKVDLCKFTIATTVSSPLRSRDRVKLDDKRASGAIYPSLKLRDTEVVCPLRHLEANYPSNLSTITRGPQARVSRHLAGRSRDFHVSYTHARTQLRIPAFAIRTCMPACSNTPLLLSRKIVGVRLERSARVMLVMRAPGDYVEAQLKRRDMILGEDRSSGRTSPLSLSRCTVQRSVSIPRQPSRGFPSTDTSAHDTRAYERNRDARVRARARARAPLSGEIVMRYSRRSDVRWRTR